ncbi:MAG: hypothetical protein JNL62_15415, partial [Bryobacterales bacterium]|nr:hypothetical protein [Bryobacterales bacterium]
MRAEVVERFAFARDAPGGDHVQELGVGSAGESVDVDGSVCAERKWLLDGLATGQVGGKFVRADGDAADVQLAGGADCAAVNIVEVNGCSGRAEDGERGGTGGGCGGGFGDGGEGEAGFEVAGNTRVLTGGGLFGDFLADEFDEFGGADETVALA